MNLIFDKVTKRFGGVHAVTGVSAAFPPGKIHSLIGPNGAGKSTLINMAAGSYSVTDGEIRLGDVVVSRMKKHRIAQAGIARTYQNIRLFDYMTVLQNLEVSLFPEFFAKTLEEIFLPWRDRLHKVEREERCLKVLEEFGLVYRANELAANLPYGEQKLLEIARALVGRPKVLLLDEPAAGLNSAETAALRDRILRLRRPDLVILVVEHDMQLVMSISDDIVVLHQGKLLARGTPHEIQQNEAVREAYLGNEQDAEELKAAARRRRDQIGLRQGGRSPRHHD